MRNLASAPARAQVSSAPESGIRLRADRDDVFRRELAALRPALLRYARSRRVPDAEDATNGAMLDAWTGRHTFDPVKAPLPVWLRQVLRNCVARACRKADARRLVIDGVRVHRSAAIVELDIEERLDAHREFARKTRDVVDIDAWLRRGERAMKPRPARFGARPEESAALVYLSTRLGEGASLADVVRELNAQGFRSRRGTPLRYCVLNKARRRLRENATTKGGAR